MNRFGRLCCGGLVAVVMTATYAWSAEPAVDTGSRTRLKPIRSHAPSAEPADETVHYFQAERARVSPARAEPGEDLTHTIFGIVMELRSGTADVPVCLCSAETGMPVVKDTYGPFEWGKASEDGKAVEMAITVTDEKGRFRFENVPDGKYRLIAQKWIGPYKGIFEMHGTVIQLMGAADEVVVPRPSDHYQARVVLSPPGKGIVEFDQDVGNDGTFMFLSLAPLEFDPILVFDAMRGAFLRNLVGVNRMPLGKTTVIGAPDRPMYAFFFAADNSPGIAAVEVPPSRSGLVRVKKEQYIAGWSDGRKTPPPKLAELGEFMDKHSLTVRDVLDIPELSHATHKEYKARMKELSGQLHEEVELPEGRLVRVGDLLAVQYYQRLKKF